MYRFRLFYIVEYLVCDNVIYYVEKKRGIEFVFDYVQLLYYKCHRINFNRGGSYIDSLDWIKNKKATINPSSKNDIKYFQYLVVLNYEEIKKDPQRITKIKPLTNKYDREGINFPSGKNNWKKLRKIM